MTQKENVPDVVALPLDRAEEILRRSGAVVEVLKTYPTRPMRGSCRWRVVRQKMNASGQVVLTAAEECEGIGP